MHFFKTQKGSPPLNLLQLKPKRNYDWESAPDNRVVILVPKFGYPRLFRLLAPRLAESRFRVRLDDFGSFVWRQCDGATTVAEIVARLRARYGEAVEPAPERVGLFVQRLLRNTYVSVATPESPQTSASW